MPLRTCKHPKPSARGFRSATSVSAVAKSRAFTKPLLFHCASLSDRAPRAQVSRRNDGLLRKETAGQVLANRASALAQLNQIEGYGFTEPLAAHGNTCASQFFCEPR